MTKYTTVELNVLAGLADWHFYTKGGQRKLNLRWTDVERKCAERLEQWEYIAWEEPPWRDRGFYVLTDKGKAVLREAELEDHLKGG